MDAQSTILPIKVELPVSFAGDRNIDERSGVMARVTASNIERTTSSAKKNLMSNMACVF